MDKPWWTIMALTTEEKELIIFGLSMRRNYIETGDPILSAIDAQNLGHRNMIRALGHDQIELLGKINDLIKKVENTL